MGTRMNVRYDRDGDLLELWWKDDPGYYTATSDDRVEVQLDSDGNVQGFLIWGLSNTKSSVTVDIPDQAWQEALSERS